MIKLTNLSGVTDITLDFGHVLRHQNRMAGHYDRQQVLTEQFIIAPTDLAYGMTRMYQSLAEGRIPLMRLHLFRSEAEALAAMGRKETSIAQLLGT